MEKRYPALHIISLLFKVLSVVIVILGIVLIILVLVQGDTSLYLPRVFGSTLLTLGVVPIILFTLVSALILWGIAELVVCLIDIENNTRIMMTKESQPKETPVTPAAVVTPPAVTPAAPVAQPAKPEEESEEKKAAAALAARKQSFKDVLNKKLW
jgi:hypothetical protein